MIVKKNVQSSNLAFKQLEVNKDTVFYRFNERKWIEKDEETDKDVHVGWIYDEVWYEKDNYIEQISEENQNLNNALMELVTIQFENQIDTDMAIMELVHMIGGE